MKKFKLIRSEVVPMLITETVEIEANDLKEAIEDVVEGYGEVISSDQEEVASIYNIERHADTNTISIYDENNKKLLYTDNDTFAYGHNPYKCFE
jgi:hypothetical protein|nr:MAG TPA: RNA polymerase inhibitor [Crassvirales sp.]